MRISPTDPPPGAWQFHTLIGSLASLRQRDWPCQSESGRVLPFVPSCPTDVAVLLAPIRRSSLSQPWWLSPGTRCDWTPSHRP